MLPYQMMLHKGTRESMGLRLTNCVVVFDEAHNLLDTINAMYTASLTAHQVSACALACVCSIGEPLFARGPRRGAHPCVAREPTGVACLPPPRR